MCRLYYFVMLIQCCRYYPQEPDFSFEKLQNMQSMNYMYMYVYDIDMFIVWRGPCEVNSVTRRCKGPVAVSSAYMTWTTLIHSLH